MIDDDTSQTNIRTLAHYARNADAFRSGTADHDVNQNLDALLSAIPIAHPRILDLGCGPGRDLVALTQRGALAVGLDGSAPFVDMARTASGCDVWHQDFLALDLPPARFDGVFANASLFHVPIDHLPGVLSALHSTLDAGGVLFSSNPRGDNRAGWQGERYCVFHDLEQWRRYLHAAGFDEIRHYYRPEGMPREQQPWLASVWRKRPLAPA
ncbi:class I SAM-dependent methyltransferase [Alcaligenaceae bacterium C4P045]|nr:class I SAM-dependent methyltransferase [Alcaligenaceae bacterium C4P045]